MLVLSWEYSSNDNPDRVLDCVQPGPMRYTSFAGLLRLPAYLGSDIDYGVNLQIVWLSGHFIDFNFELKNRCRAGLCSTRQLL